MAPPVAPTPRSRSPGFGSIHGFREKRAAGPRGAEREGLARPKGQVEGVVMEYVEGENLRQRIRRTGPLEPERALDLAGQACGALYAAHQRGIIHRDTKPQTLLLTAGPFGNDLLKVIDFGIAKVREDAGL